VLALRASSVSGALRGDRGYWGRAGVAVFCACAISFVAYPQAQKI
jgi:hypothetical protein